ncbi:hypothetical protein KQI65_10930 [bacterium]|nr:hypothetical protein [bacterium]
MKRLILAVVAGLLCLIPVTTLAQQLTFIQGSDYTRSIRGKYNVGPPASWNPITDPTPRWDGSFRVGDWESGSDRYLDVMAIQWILPASLDSGAYVDSVRLTILYRNYQDEEMAVLLYHADYELPSSASDDIFYDVTLQRQPQIPEVHLAGSQRVNNDLSDTDGKYFYASQDETYANAPLRDAVQAAVDADQGFFTLLLGPFQSFTDRVWYIKPMDVLLEVYYTPPDPELIAGVTITNVVDGIRDWDVLPESIVRGDENAYDTTGFRADYAQLPAFETPPATRSWWQWKDHLTETFFAKFEHQSLTGRHKFKHWNETESKYRVREFTGIWDGRVDDYTAEADTATKAGNLVKREITSAYSGLSFDFKDPWRVDQNLASTEPPIAQYIRDGFTEQTSPYEPWNDSQSWGVFKDVNRNEAPYYATRYWKYYDYDAGSDTYTRKDGLPLDEGDLIHMDQISLGGEWKCLQQGA